MKKMTLLALSALVALMALVGCSRQQDEKIAAVPNANCQYPNQPGCFPQNTYGYGYQPYNNGYYGAQAYNGCPVGYQPTMYPGYGMGCMPQQYFQGNNTYYQQANYNPYYNQYYQLNTYGYNNYAVMCDVANGQYGCPAGTTCRAVGTGRVGVCCQ